MTHDLLRNLLLHLDAQVEKVVVNELRDNTFYAQLFILYKGDMMTIDARPSDAIALALRTDAPIFVSESVIDQSQNITLDKEDLRPKDVADWLENLSPEDLGKYKM